METFRWVCNEGTHSKKDQIRISDHSDQARLSELYYIDGQCRWATDYINQALNACSCVRFYYTVWSSHYYTVATRYWRFNLQLENAKCQRGENLVNLKFSKVCLTFLWLSLLLMNYMQNKNQNIFFKKGRKPPKNLLLELKHNWLQKAASQSCSSSLACFEFVHLLKKCDYQFSADSVLSFSGS